MQILDFPAQSGHVLQMGKWDQVPFWLAMHHAEKKAPMRGSEFFPQLFSQPISHLFQFLERNRVARHALELIFENQPQVAVT